uniref:Uncharacterized protein n=1 Tax=Cucumis sativus TaxID=3659 RepID=A0A0A0KMS2_CUCSA
MYPIFLIDRLLVTDICAIKFGSFQVHQLDHVDHFPLAMTTGDIDWGPCPFKFENSWLSTPSFRPPVETWWTNNRVAGWPRHGMMMKLKALKCSFRSWNNNKHREATKLPSLISQL